VTHFTFHVHEAGPMITGGLIIWNAEHVDESARTAGAYWSLLEPIGTYWSLLEPIGVIPNGFDAERRNMTRITRSLKWQHSS